MIPKILIVHGGHHGGRTERLRVAAAEGARASGEIIELREKPALAADAEDLLWADGILLATPEHFAYMSGALKDFFDRTFYAVESHTIGRPYGLLVSAGNDGQGTIAAVRRIVTGYRWKEIADPVLVIGDPKPVDIERCRELGATLAAGLAAGIF
jgi:multimeric flavodoxin WrbA